MRSTSKPTTLPFCTYSFGEYGTFTPTTSLPADLTAAGTRPDSPVSVDTEFDTDPVGPPESSLLLAHPDRASAAAVATPTSAVMGRRRDDTMTSNGTDLATTP